VTIAFEPQFMTVQRWTAETGSILWQFGTVGRLDDAAKWREWASGVVQIPAIAVFGPPHPEEFSTWQAWAAQFNIVVRLLPT
jgi:hypothetical protein